ncbi:hypothetical protein BDZ89DRAFT_1063359 [Hymenopellis radicata]|nr:hypothetical protein BDZ89DRAFT_1063359 [Hymenopellis radicata]
MPLIAPSQADAVVALFIEEEIELAFYGFYAATALMSAALLLHKGLRGSYARIGLLLVTIVMFGLSTGHVYISSIFNIIAFPTLTSDPAGYNPQWLIDRSNRLRTDAQIIRRIDYFISDAVVVWRTWCIYYDNAWVRAYLALVLVATGATSIACGILQGKVDGLVTNFLGTFCLLVTNFSTTALCGYKVWYYRRFIKSAYAGRRRKTLVENVLLILVESGMLYCIFWLLFMLADFGYFSGGPLGPAFGLEYFMPHFSGIYVSMIILVVALSKSSSETFFSVVDRDLEHQFPNAGDVLEKLEFAPAPKSTLITDPESSLATTGMHDEGVTSIVDLGRRGSDTTDGEDFPQPQ